MGGWIKGGEGRAGGSGWGTGFGVRGGELAHGPMPSLWIVGGDHKMANQGDHQGRNTRGGRSSKCEAKKRLRLRDDGAGKRGGVCLSPTSKFKFRTSCF